MARLYTVTDVCTQSPTLQSVSHLRSQRWMASHSESAAVVILRDWNARVCFPPHSCHTAKLKWQTHSQS